MADGGIRPGDELPGDDMKEEEGAILSVKNPDVLLLMRFARGELTSRERRAVRQRFVTDSKFASFGKPLISYFSIIRRRNLETLSGRRRCGWWA